MENFFANHHSGNEARTPVATMANHGSMFGFEGGSFEGGSFEGGGPGLLHVMSSSHSSPSTGGNHSSSPFGLYNHQQMADLRSQLAAPLSAQQHQILHQNQHQQQQHHQHQHNADSQLPEMAPSYNANQLGAMNAQSAAHQGVTTRSASYGRPPTRPTLRSARVASMAPVEQTIATPVVPKEEKAPTRRRNLKRQQKRKIKDEDTTSTSPPKKRRASLKKPPPSSGDAGLKKEAEIDDTNKEGSASCCICMCEPKPVDLASISGCEHVFCFECIEKWADRENTCPLCKARFSKIDRVHKRKSSADRKTKNTKRVKQKDQRSDISPNAALEGLLASLTNNQFPPRYARLVINGNMVGNPFFQISTTGRQGTPFGSRRHRPSERPAGSGLEDNLFSSDTEDESDDVGFLSGSVVAPSAVSFSELIRSIPGSRGFVMGGSGATGGRLQVLRPMSFTHFSPASARSYASNMNDQSAGLGAENPLEIDDSDDDEVEVIELSRPV